MKRLKCLGLIALGEVTIIGISGGFGVGCLSILAKDVAKIHGREVGNVNRLINNNREKFRDGIDIIDLKTDDSEAFVLQLGITKAEYGNANNIYLLSERGYSKLIKLMDDDLAWERYELLLDDYFSKRDELEALKQELQRDSYQIADPIERAYAWAEEEKQRRALLEANKKKDTLLLEQEPKVEFYNEVMESDSTFPTGVVAKQLGLKSAQELNRFLVDKGIQYKKRVGKSSYYVLSAKYADKGYAKEIIVKNGAYTSRQLRWTELGVKFIYDLLKK